MTSKTFNPDFYKVDLLALYATMSLKKIVAEKLPWKQHLNTLYEEIKQNMKQLGKEKESSLFSSLKEFSRMYQNQWTTGESDNEEVSAGVEMYYSLLVVLALRLGLDKLWVSEGSSIKEDVVADGLLNHKPKLKLTYLSQGDPLYNTILPLCPNLEHVSMPFSDKSLFIKAVNIKSLRVLEFSTGVSDKVLCHALWNIDKKSDKVLQMAIKDKKDGEICLALPHLEVLRSNIQLSKNGCQSMRVTLGAAALALQPKLRIVENRYFWSTLQAIQVLLDFESRYKIKHERRLAVDRLLIEDLKFTVDFLATSLPLILRMCPAISSLTITLGYLRLTGDPIYSSLQAKISSLKNLSIDARGFFVEDFWSFLSNIGPKLKKLTLRVTLPLINSFEDLKRRKRDAYSALISAQRCVETFTLIFSELEDCSSYQPEAIISLLICFPQLKTLRYYNLYYLPPMFAVYSCIAGSLACSLNLQHLSINGSVTSMFDNSSYYRSRNIINEDIPTLSDNSTFNVLKTLKSFTLDALFLCPRVDRFLELLRFYDVHVRVLYRPCSKKGLDPSIYFDYNEFIEIYGLDSDDEDSLF